jgi:C4-dicarboxylate-binding protein DctP
VTNHGYIGYIVVVNKKFWEDLPADIRGQLDKAMQEATLYGNEIAEKENTEAMEAIRKSGRSTILVATEAENAAMRKAMEPIYDDMAKRVGKATIDEFVKEAAGATN